MNFDEIKKVADDVPESGFTVLKIDVDIDASGYRDLLEKQAVNIIMPEIPQVRRSVRMPKGRQHARNLLHTLRPS